VRNDSEIPLPSDIGRLVDELARSRGVVAVAIGGSRAVGTADANSDWDIGVYYQGDLDLEPIRAYGEVHPPGAWGRIMNGGAWLQVGNVEVDVVLRDLDVVEHWSKRAVLGEFEVDALLAYLAGVPTYMLLAERAVGRFVTGDLPSVTTYPERLAETAPPRWRFCSAFSLEQARTRASRGDIVGAVGQAAKAVIEAAHAGLAEQRRWVFNEKRIVESAGLGAASPLFAQVPSDPDALLGWIERVGAVVAG
jgi:hypothetical protein